jgi:hypothetical protein
MALVVKSPDSNRWNACFLSLKNKKKTIPYLFYTKTLKGQNNINIKIKIKPSRSHHSSDGINTVFIFMVAL